VITKTPGTIGCAVVDDIFVADRSLLADVVDISAPVEVVDSCTGVDDWR